MKIHSASQQNNKETAMQFKNWRFLKFNKITSFTTRVVFHHFVSFSSKTKSLGVLLSVTYLYVMWTVPHF